jgi:hypothetical protein
MNDSDTSPATSIVFVDATAPISGDARPAELVAQVLGIAADKAADIVERAGGIVGFTNGTESDLLGAGVPRRKVKPFRAAFELARLSIGKRPSWDSDWPAPATSSPTCERGSRASQPRSSGPSRSTSGTA